MRCKGVISEQKVYFLKIQVIYKWVFRQNSIESPLICLIYLLIKIIKSNLSEGYDVMCLVYYGRNVSLTVANVKKKKLSIPST